MDNTPKRPYKGNYTDVSPLNQPEGTTRFVLNGVEESRDGDRQSISNEEKFTNNFSITLPTDYVPLEEVYVGDRNKVIFLVKNDNSLSEIGLMDREQNYTTLVNSADLGFNVNTSIDAVFRLRRGCERTIYWADPKLRSLNIDDLGAYKDDSGEWDMDKFKLFKTYSKIPKFDQIEVVREGNLPPGSYNITVQYLDEDFNPTEWITVSETIIIYNDNLEKNYLGIRGSTNRVNPYQDFGNTDKAIKVTFGNLDKDYPFYRVGIIEANEGTGQITRVAVSQERPTDIITYTYTGNVATTVPVEEISEFNTIIEEAQHLEQIENRLIPANVKGKDINYCRLQKYASKIKADAVTKEVTLNNIENGNPKSPTLYFDGAGYMPGEIYSFAINYIFKDNTISPSFHIPGKVASTVDTCFTPGSHPMSIDNELDDTFYTDNSDCGVLDYWGKDSEGDDLQGEKVRHHRFPTRGELGLDFITETDTVVGEEDVVHIEFDVTGTIDGGYTEDFITFGIIYSIDGGSNKYGEATFAVADYTSGDTIRVATEIRNGGFVVNFGNQVENGAVMGYQTSPTPLGLTYTYDPDVTTQDKIRKDQVSDSIGIRFSGISVPSKEELNGEEVIGYYITRNERTEDQKTILDNAVLVPLLEEEYYVGAGHMWPDLSDQTRIKRDVVGFISPESSFFKKDYRNINEVIKIGELTKWQQSASNVLIQDVMAGTSFDPEIHKRRDEDTDGFDLHFLARDTDPAYDAVSPAEVITDTYGIENVFYLDALESRTITDSSGNEKEIFNVSADNRMGFIQFDDEIPLDNLSLNRKPYVILKRNLSNPYQNFRLDPYYKEHSNPQFFTFTGTNLTGGDTLDIFNGDAVVTPMRYTTSSFYDIRLAERDTKSGLFNFILGVVGIVAGAIAAIFTAGASLTLVGLGISAIGLGVSQVAAGIKKENMRRVWGQLYEDGLRDTLNDGDTEDTLEYSNSDDEIQWFSDTTSNLWFESSVNMALRQGASQNIPDFLDAPVNSVAKVASDFTKVNNTQNEVDAYILSKLTLLDPENSDGRLYQGYANAELYEINPDYLRRNREKFFFHLPLEYDCCSDCSETFTHRYHYSEPSFDEELTDNFRVFLPNNYRDIEGNTGDITNIYRFYDNLYIHTEDALWMQPKNYQERVTDEIVSFIGTGSYFEIPPKKILDGEESSAGTKHKQGTKKTKHGIFFISEKEKKLYQFDGQRLKAITDEGVYNWFSENLTLNAEEDYYRVNRREPELRDNPQNPLGSGYVLGYDPRHERLLITKRDYNIPTDTFLQTFYRVSYDAESVTIFENFNNTVSNLEGQGYEYLGIEDGKLKFIRIEYETVSDSRYDSAGDPIADVDVENISIEVIYSIGDSLPITDWVGTDRSWTRSYSLRSNSWISFHTYMPNKYFNESDEFQYWEFGSTYLWRQGKSNSYLVPHIIEFVSNENPSQTKIWDFLNFNTDAMVFDEETHEFLEQRYRTFNKMLLYNGRQISGELTLVPKDFLGTGVDYIEDQISDTEQIILLDRNEDDWTVNNFRDMRTDHTVPMFTSAPEDLQDDYFIDKIINPGVVDFDKNWTELESFRGKYLIIRLIFDTFTNTKLITNFSRENETPSKR